MRRIKTVALLTAGLLFAGIASAPGADFIQTNSFSVGEEGRIADELWLSANAIEIKGQANNDLFLLAGAESWDEKEGTIRLAGRFENDIWAIGSKVELSGFVHDHVRLLARNITITGSVSNNAFLIGNSVQVTGSAQLDRETLIFGEHVVLEGNIGGNVLVLCKSATLSGHFGGNVRVMATDIVVLPQARIGGDLTYRSPTELVLDKGVVLGGKLAREQEELHLEQRRSLFSWPSLIMQAWLFLGAMCAGAFLLFLFPVFVDEAAAQIRNMFWKSLLVGFVMVCLVPMACFFLAVSLIALPLAALLAASLMILIYISKIFVGLMVGALIVRRKPFGLKAFPVMGLGLALLYAVAGAGLSGIIASFLIVCLGMGGMTLAFLARRPVFALKSSVP